jgi:hypothetical protein
MNAKRLTLIRRARNAIEDAMRRRSFSDRLALDHLRTARRHLRAATNFTMTGRPEFAAIEMTNAATHLKIVLGAA